MGFVRTASGGAYGGYRFEPDRAGVCLMICDPFTFPADYLLDHLNSQAGGTLVMGGMASGGVGLRQSRLFRGILGANPETGAIAVGDEVEVGQTLQFHVRDAASADQDLQRTLEEETAALGGQRPAGALLFTCNGRGSRLFPEPDHDARLLAKVLAEIPVAGFFCAGELGPVGGQNYLHTFTASIALFPGMTG